MSVSDASTLSPRAALVHRLAAAQGFAMVGIAPAEPSDHADHFRAWLDAGKHGEMDYLARYADIAVDPDRALPGAKAIICVADGYGGGRDEETERRRDEVRETEGEGSADHPFNGSALSSSNSALPTPHSAIPPSGSIARYAQGDDYHWVMKDRLHAMCDALRESFPDHLFRAAVDTAPIMEREHAARAGLGWIGKHTLLIHPQLGSWFMLGEILTTLPIETNADRGFPAPTIPPGDHCGSCSRCIDACPTQCITPHSVDGSRCISYLTIEHRSAIDPELHPLMGQWLAGCDVCQEVCPYNEKISDFGFAISDLPDKGSSAPDDRRSAIRNPQFEIINPKSPYAPRLTSIPLLDILEWTEDDRRAAFKRSALKRIKLDMIKRNALIAAGNALLTRDGAALRGRIGAMAEDAGESELVRVTARQVLLRLTVRDAGR